MRLSAKILKNVNSINSWQYVSQAFMQEGQANVMHIQLVDLELSTSIAPEKSTVTPEHPIRYISGATTISVVAFFDALETATQFSVTATQPFPNDKSIFRFDLTSIQIPNSGNVKITVTEDTTVRTFIIRNAINITTLNTGGC